MIKGIVFDLDHTLFDRYKTMETVLPIMYKWLPHIIYKDLSCKDFIKGIIKCDRENMHKGWGPTFEALKKEKIISADADINEFISFLTTECWPVAAVKFPFTEPTLTYLKNKGYKLGLITNGIYEPQKMKVDMLGLADYFDEMVFCGLLPKQKPDTLPFEEMSKRLKLSPDELMYVGDNPLNDVEASRNAGYTPVWINTTKTWIFPEIKHAEYELDTIEGLPELLRKINI